MSKEELTFNALLSQFMEKQINALDQAEGVTTSYLDSKVREELLNQVKDVVEEPNRPKLFDRVSLKNMSELFEEVDNFYQQLQQETHPVHLVYPDPSIWFQQSYNYMFDTVAFLEMVRFFAGGKTPDEKEIAFRTLVSKLIKTQDTVRTISSNSEFLKQYLENQTQLKEQFPAIFAEKNNLPEPLSPSETVTSLLQEFVNDLSKSCLALMDELEIDVPAGSQKALDSKLYYEGLILMMRHSAADLFGELGSDDYPILVEELTKVSRQTQIHPNIFLFQHAKRQYLIHWLVHDLRKKDREGADTFYQAGKAAVYAKFKKLSLDRPVLEQLVQRENLENAEVIEAEINSLNALTEDDLYALLLKIYTFYKNDELLSQNMPLAPQALSSSGDITWDKQNMVAQTAKKVKELEATGGGAGKKASKFSSMLVGLKKATKVFSIASKRVDNKKAQKVVTTERSAASEASSGPPEPPPPPPPSIEVRHTGTLIEPCFPLPKRDCLNPVQGQKQDLSFNNSDDLAGVAPLEQGYIINIFNLENEPNLPEINKNFLKFGEMVRIVLDAYGDTSQRIQKKYTSGVNVESFSEEVLYLKIKEDVILVVGITQMGAGKKMGTLPDKQTAYFRLFVKGSLARGLNKFGVPSVLKEFKVNEKAQQFKEIAIPTHYKEAPQYQAVLVDALASVIEGLPEKDFIALNDDEAVGFVSILQQKARELIEQKGIKMSREV
ncbi:MAG: hypothetical protein HQM14_09020 [SAR324 cluster bacterium]|nr:hypothetical protein [SAR324 cluster bacterium]